MIFWRHILLKQEHDMIYDIIVIGAGPAGMTASIYAARNKANVCLLEHND